MVIYLPCLPICGISAPSHSIHNNVTVIVFVFITSCSRLSSRLDRARAVNKIDLDALSCLIVLCRCRLTMVNVVVNNRQPCNRACYTNTITDSQGRRKELFRGGRFRCYFLQRSALFPNTLYGKCIKFVPKKVGSSDPM